jgi:hypothetical protein
MDQIGGEPAIGKRRAVGAPENDRACLAQIVDHRTVGLGDDIALQLEAIGGGKTDLVYIDLHRHRHAGQCADIFTARDRCVDGGSLRQHVLGTVVDHGIDFRVDRVEPSQPCRGGLPGRYLLRPYQRSQVRSRQTPEIFHGQLRLI